MVKLDTFGERLRASRLRADMTQRELAVAIDARENDIRRWENDRHLPSPTRLRDIATTLDVSLDWLFDVPGAQPPTGIYDVADNGRQRRRA